MDTLQVAPLTIDIPKWNKLGKYRDKWVLLVSEFNSYLAFYTGTICKSHLETTTHTDKNLFGKLSFSYQNKIQT